MYTLIEGLKNVRITTGTYLLVAKVYFNTQDENSYESAMLLLGPETPNPPRQMFL